MNKLLIAIAAFFGGNAMLVSALGMMFLLTTSPAIGIESVALTVLFMLGTCLSYTFSGVYIAGWLQDRQDKGTDPHEYGFNDSPNQYNGRDGNGYQPIRPAKDYAED